MKIGILTQQILGNYGGILQNFALQKVLRAMGHKAVTIDYRESLIDKKEYRRLRWRYIRKFVKFKHPDPVGPRYRQRSSKSVAKFVSRYMKMTQVVVDYTDPKVKKQKFDCLIVGSDQVWRPIYNHMVLEDMFLRFARGWDVKRIAYAASFGTSEKEFDDNTLKMATELIHDFDYVSVREKSGVELFVSYFGFRPDWVADPTLLLDRRVYDDVADKSCVQRQIVPQSYIFKYVLDCSESIDKSLAAIAEKVSVEEVISAGNYDKNVSLQDWLRSIRDARMVLTDSFHGTVFSIIFQVPFIAVCNYDRGADRFYSLLERLGLEDRLTNRETPIEELVNMALAPIDWANVESKLSAFKEESLDKLRKALNDKG